MRHKSLVQDFFFLYIYVHFTHTLTPIYTQGALEIKKKKKVSVVMPSCLGLSLSAPLQSISQPAHSSHSGIFLPFILFLQTVCLLALELFALMMMDFRERASSLLPHLERFLAVCDCVISSVFAVAMRDAYALRKWRFAVFEATVRGSFFSPHFYQSFITRGAGWW